MPEENELCAPPADAAKGFGSAILRKTGDVSLLFLLFLSLFSPSTPSLFFSSFFFFFPLLALFFFFFPLTLGHI